jgi:hypothetical protein
MLCLLIHPVSFSPPVLCRAIGVFNAFTQAVKVLNSGHGVNLLADSIAPHLTHDTHQFDLEYYTTAAIYFPFLYVLLTQFLRS